MNTHAAFMGLAGGALIGLAASLLLLTLGRTAGISGIFAGSASGPQRHWQRLFLGGLILGGALSGPFLPLAFSEYSGNTFWTLLIAGVLVGYGTRLGNGCTSGHGVCGLSRMSGRSLAATLTFMTAAALTVYIVRHALLGTS